MFVVKFVTICLIYIVCTTTALLATTSTKQSFGKGSFRPSSALFSAKTAAPKSGHGFGVNGFGRIGRLVTRIMVDDPRADLKAINTGADASYMAYQVRENYVIF